MQPGDLEVLVPIVLALNVLALSHTKCSDAVSNPAGNQFTEPIVFRRSLRDGTSLCVSSGAEEGLCSAGLAEVQCCERGAGYVRKVKE